MDKKQRFMEGRKEPKWYTDFIINKRPIHDLDTLFGVRYVTFGRVKKKRMQATIINHEVR